MADGIFFSEKEFYQQQDVEDSKWGWAVNGAFFLHAIVFFAALYLPGLIASRPLLDEVMTIDLVSLPEPPAPIAEAQPPVSAQKNVPDPEPAPPPEPEAIPLESVPTEVVPEVDVEVKPISIQPLKRKIKKAKDTRLVEEKQREQQAVDRQRRLRDQERARQKALARAKEEEQRAVKAAQRARAELASVLREQDSLRATKRSTGESRGNKQVNTAIENQYYADLASRVQQLWILPEIKNWSAQLETRVEFSVLQDGRLVNLKVVKSSGDPIFDRFARESVRKAAPMPRFPAVLKKERLDLGLRLMPAGVQ